MMQVQHTLVRSFLKCTARQIEVVNDQTNRPKLIKKRKKKTSFSFSPYSLLFLHNFYPSTKIVSLSGKKTINHTLPRGKSANWHNSTSVIDGDFDDLTGPYRVAPTAMAGTEIGSILIDSDGIRGDA